MISLCLSVHTLDPGPSQPLVPCPFLVGRVVYPRIWFQVPSQLLVPCSFYGGTPVLPGGGGFPNIGQGIPPHSCPGGTPVLARGGATPDRSSPSQDWVPSPPPLAGLGCPPLPRPQAGHATGGTPLAFSRRRTVLLQNAFVFIWSHTNAKIRPATLIL